MGNRVGLVVSLVVIGGVLAVLFGSVKKPPIAPAVPPKLVSSATPSASSAGATAGQGGALAGVERPIGETEQAHMQIAAFYLPPVEMEGRTLPQDKDIIHLEADVHAIEGNPNGFALGEWIPYLRIRYEIAPDGGSGETLRGQFDPMVAKDGPHYGATIRMPGPGKYRLRYEFEPPSVNGFGRHTDPVTGVGPWWEPFNVEFPFVYEPVKFPQPNGATGNPSRDTAK